MRDEQYLKQASKPQMETGSCIAGISPPTARQMLLERAEALRREAYDLEHLARSLPPEGAMGEQAERTLSSCVSARIYR